uniref:Putative secreted protein n=1 Tax=Ixodes ricinus TaxID=34613 RepID=A0A6B0U4J6_IXORI
MEVYVVCFLFLLASFWMWKHRHPESCRQQFVSALWPPIAKLFELKVPSTGSFLPLLSLNFFRKYELQLAWNCILSL